MKQQMTVPDVRKQVTVPVPAPRAFAIFADHPIEWWPEKHVFVTDRRSITIEQQVGGRYYERGADGTEIAWGTVVEWDPPHRIVLTWRIGPGWQPLTDDDGASFIEVDFAPAGPGSTVVTLTHSGLERHGAIAQQVHAALNGPDPGETLAQYSRVVTRHTPPAGPAGPVTLINRFTLHGPPEEFEEVFTGTSAFFTTQPGFLDNTLMRSMEDPKSYVNVAKWASARSLTDAVAQPGFRPHREALAGLATSEPVLYLTPRPSAG